MGISKKDYKVIEQMLREIPKPDYEDLVDFLGLPAPELRILDLKYRYSNDVYRPTREYIAEEVGMSVSTLDRRLKSILKRIGKYAQRIIPSLGVFPAE